MKKNIFYMAALAVIAAACTNEDTLVTNPANNGTSDVKMITETISATNGDEATRAAVDADAKFTWSTGDQIAVHVSDGKYYTTEALAAGGSKNATFSVTYPDGQARDAFAIYPASLVAADAANYGQSGATLDVTLPASYTLAEVSGTKTPCPMIATNATGSGWTFSQLCGLLRLTVNSIPASTSYLKIDFNGKKVQGAFSIASDVTPGASTIATSATDGTDDIITITDLGLSSWTDGMVLNLPLPTGEYTKVTVTAYSSSDAAILTVTNNFTYTATRKKGVKKTVSLPFFSASSTKKVTFAPGNLQATYSTSTQTWTWHFAEHQYDFIGNDGGNKLITTTTKEDTEPYAKLSADGTVDLFGWSSNATYYGIATSQNSMNPTPNDYTGDFIDWGTIDIDGNGAGYWRSMSCNNDNNNMEWYYLMKTRSGATVNEVANARFAIAAINTDGTRVNGMILFPDNYSGPATSTSDITFGKINQSGKDGSWPDWGGTSCTVAGWAILESVGCVFLPAAGERKGTNVDFSYNCYASKTNNGVWGWYPMRFRSGTSQYNVYWNGTHYRYQGVSVRLVHDLN